MYIIIYIINYNEYIVMYNIESHSLTITSTTWLNNVPHWYTNCKCTDKKALDEVNEASKVAYAQRALIFFFSSLYTFYNSHIYIFRIIFGILFDLFLFLFFFHPVFFHIFLGSFLTLIIYTSFRYTRLTYTQMRHVYPCDARKYDYGWWYRLNRCMI